MPSESEESKYLTPKQIEKLPYALKQGIIRSKKMKVPKMVEKMPDMEKPMKPKRGRKPKNKMTYNK